MTHDGSESIWDQGDYEQVGSRIGELAVRLVDTVERRTAGLTGSRVVDLACGTGNASLEAARRGARVTGTDLAPGLLRQAAGKARAEGLDVHWKVADATETGLPAGAFEVAMSSVGLVMVAERAKAVAETARLLESGGVVAWTAWCDQPDNPFGAPLRDFVPNVEPGAPTSQDWSDEVKVEGWLRTAGFVDVVVERWDFMWRFPDVETPMRIAFEASPLHLAALRSVPTSQHPALRRAFEQAFAVRRTETGAVQFANPYVVVSAVKP